MLGVNSQNEVHHSKWVSATFPCDIQPRRTFFGIYCPYLQPLWISNAPLAYLRLNSFNTSHQTLLSVCLPPASISANHTCKTSVSELQFKGTCPFVQQQTYSGFAPLEAHRPELHMAGLQMWTGYIYLFTTTMCVMPSSSRLWLFSPALVWDNLCSHRVLIIWSLNFHARERGTEHWLVEGLGWRVRTFRCP